MGMAYKNLVSFFSDASEQIWIWSWTNLSRSDYPIFDYERKRYLCHLLQSLGCDTWSIHFTAMLCIYCLLLTWLFHIYAFSFSIANNFWGLSYFIFGLWRTLCRGDYRLAEVVVIIIGHCPSLGTTVFLGMRNFEPSCGNCLYPRNLYIFCGRISQNSVLGTNTARFGQV